MKRLVIFSFLLIFNLIILHLCSKNPVYRNPYDPEYKGKWAPSKLEHRILNIHTIKLTWSQDEENIDGFKVDKKIGNENWYIEYDKITNNKIREYVDSSAVPDGTNSYRVYAYAGDNESNSVEKDISIVFQSPTNLTINQLSIDKLELKWNDNSKGETGYIIERKIENYAWSKIATVYENTTNFIDTNVVTDTKINYRVCGYCGSKKSSYCENNCQNEFKAPCQLSAEFIDRSYIKLCWLDSCCFESGFEVEKRTNENSFTNIAQLEANIITFLDSNFTFNDFYEYRVRAISQKSKSKYSNIASIKYENTAPKANFLISQVEGNTNTQFTFSATLCTDKEDDISLLQTRWDWENDGIWDTDYSTTKIDTHTFKTPNTYNIKLEVKDTGGLTTDTTRSIIVFDIEKHPPIASFTVSPDSGQTNTLFSFNASACSDVEDDISLLQVRWDWENDGTWDTEYSTAKTDTHKYKNAGEYQINLEVIDTDGLTESCTQIITVKDTISTEYITDFDGNTYKTVKIGDQWWMAENLKVTHYRNGDAIPNITDNTSWSNLSTGAYCAYNNDESNSNAYGNLYNWYVIGDSRNIAPDGWHVPTDDEWQNLENYLSDSGYSGIEGSALKASAGWPNGGNGTNNFGFNGIPSGYRIYHGSYESYRDYAYFWSSSEVYSFNARYRYLSYENNEFRKGSFDKNYGFSIRCIKGEGNDPIESPPTASFSITPDSGTVSTIFAFNASDSYDDEDDISQLQARWDWEDDGTWDTDFSLDKTETHKYPSADIYTIRLQLKDTDELTDDVTKELKVSLDNRPPNQPSSPNPVGGSDNIPITTNLSWSCSDPDGDNIAYSVYFGTTTNPSILISNLNQNSYELNTLLYNTIYYWKVIAKDIHGDSTASDLWSFITEKETSEIENMMVQVQGGTFTMGDIWNIGNNDEKPTHEVTLDNFYISKFEITQKIYQAVTNSNPSTWLGENLPVEKVSWYNAINFCNKLSTQNGYTPCYTINGNDVLCDFRKNGFRLPTEAEWEYVARSGGSDDQIWSGTNSDGALNNYCWYSSNSNSKTHQVGSKNPNSSGVYDMSGNVGEWCWDCYNSYSSTDQINPISSQTSDTHIIRGGAYYNNADDCRNTARNRDFASSSYAFTGFRVVRSDEWSGSKTYPKAFFTISPTTGTTETIFTFDASGCSDNEDDVSELQVRWDFDNDGNWDTGYSTTKTATHQYETANTYTINLEVKDSDGLTSGITKSVTVNSPFETGTTVDSDGNIYKTIKIGNQWWMAENLRVTTYRNGDLIQNISDNTTWKNLTSGAYCAYNNDESYNETYGYLYNWYAVDDSRGIAPVGWHVPTDEEWLELKDYLTDNEHSGKELKSIDGWNSGGNGTDYYGFSALPIGYRLSYGDYYGINICTFFWTSSEISTYMAWMRALDFTNAIARDSYNKKYGFSIRCVKGELENAPPEASFSISPESGTTDTEFTFDASGCSDNEDYIAQLQVRWDFDNDGIWDTEYTTEKKVTHQFETTGTYIINLEVKDTGGLTATTSKSLMVNPTYETGTVTDVDGNEYRTVKIGAQWWMAENLKVTHYRNGNAIPNVTDYTLWRNLTTGAYCAYDNDESNADIYGRYYNWYAVGDSRNIAPEGWHIPTDDEWKELELFIGMNESDVIKTGYRGSDEGSSLMSNDFWNGNGNDDYGFNAIPTGYRRYDGFYFNINTATFFWTYSSSNIDESWQRNLYYEYLTIRRSEIKKQSGFSVRCVKGELEPENTNPTSLFTISPSSGTTSTTFVFDASGCSDAEDTNSELQVRWDWENDGNWDTEFSTSKITYHQYSSPDTYTIKLQVKDTDGATDETTKSLPVSRDNNPPNQPSSPNPSNGSTDVSITTNLSWSCGDPDGDALIYDIYFGTSSPPPLVVSNINQSSYDLSALSYGTQYYWKIVAIDSYNASTTGADWSFTTESNTYPLINEVVDTDVNDGNDGGDGNEDRKINVGEEIDLEVEIKNNGNATAYNIKGTLELITINDKSVCNITDSEELLSSLSPNSTAVFDDFDFDITGMPDDEQLNFRLIVTYTDGNGIQYSNTITGGDLDLGVYEESYKEITLSPSKDAYISADAPNNNFNESTLAVASNIYTFIHFSIPSGSEVSDAKLKFYVTSCPDKSFTLKRNQITSYWYETSVKWTSQPNVDSYSNSKTFSFSSQSPNQYIEMDATQIVRNWIELGEYNFGIRIMSDNIGMFYSSEGSYPPKLYIKYK